MKGNGKTKMLINSLCALAIGFVLDMIIGDPSGKLYPLNFIKKLINGLENKIRKTYDVTPEAQHAAGFMLVILTMIICVGVSLGLVILFYKISVLLGLIFEGILCWCSLSIKYLRSSASSVFRSARAGNLDSAKRKLKKITNREVENLDMDGVIKCAVECVSENTIDWACGPIIWILLFGGVGGIFCRCVNLLDNAVGYKTDKYKNFGTAAAKLDDVVMFVPARIAAALMRMDVKFLSLDKRNARRIYYRDKKKALSPNSAQTQSVCAGALGITLGSDEYYDGQLVRKPEIGSRIKECDPYDIYWANHLLNGTSSLCILLAAVIRVCIFLIVKFI